MLVEFVLFVVKATAVVTVTLVTAGVAAVLFAVVTAVATVAAEVELVSVAFSTSEDATTSKGIKIVSSILKTFPLNCSLALTPLNVNVFSTSEVHYLN